MITLCFDFGNTRLKYAVFSNREMLYEKVLSDASPESIQEVLQSVRPDKSILSSVIEHDKKIETVLSAGSAFHLVTNTTQLPFTSGSLAV